MNKYQVANGRLPKTPAEVLDISTPEREREIIEAVHAAEKSGQWEYPYEDAATDLKEMTLTDIFYWVYKCQHPIVNPEKGIKIRSKLITNSNLVKLPSAFEKKNSLTIGAAGDLLQAAGLDYSKDILFENISDILFDNDISYANFESPVTHQPLVKELIGDKGAPIECSSKEQFDVLTSHRGKSFTVMNTANNHMFDMGFEGVTTTWEAFDDAGIVSVGTNYTPQEKDCAKTLTVHGIKIGLVSSTFGLNGHVMPETEAYCINTANLLPRNGEPDLETLKLQIDDCKRQQCDFVLATMHWGFEFEMFPRERQITAARSLVEYGADAIVSHHPHVIQPVEYYKTERDPNRVAPIAYSLGSLTWGYTASHIVLSLVQNLTLAKGSLNGKDVTYVEKADVTPVFRSVIEQEGKLITRIEKLADHENGKSMRHSPEYIFEIKKLADNVLRQNID